MVVGWWVVGGRSLQSQAVAMLHSFRWSKPGKQTWSTARFRKISSATRELCHLDNQNCFSVSLINIELWQNHVVVVMAVVADGLVLWGARAFTDTAMGKFRPCTCSGIIPYGVASYVSDLCYHWFMVNDSSLNFSIWLTFENFITPVFLLCVCVCACEIISDLAPKNSCGIDRIS